MNKCSVCSPTATVKGMCKKHYKIAWQRANPEKRKSYYRADYDKNAARFRKHSVAWSKSNPSKARALTKAWEMKYPERRRESKRRWESANPERVRAMDSNKQARRLSAPGRHTADEVKRLFVEQRGYCVYCSRELGISYHKDHIIPLSRGGSNEIGNIQLLCAPCNQSKGSKLPEEFIQSRGLFL